MSISLKDGGWINKLYERYGITKFVANGNDVVDIYNKSQQAIDHARRLGRPSLLLVNGLVRRFGHAATDRQSAYLSAKEMFAAENTNHLFGNNIFNFISSMFSML
jgi:2-oxoisovalerate dehydrogenase E1 component